ncbi:MAG: PP2C family protein-serine/threonine phosphatase [Phycisphaerales bacterium]
MLVRGGSLVEVSDAGGMPLAVSDDAEYEEVEMQLQPGDRLMIYSDGLVEQLDPTKERQFGEERLGRLLVQHRSESGGATIDRAVDALTAWAGGTGFADDVTVMCLDWVGR